MSDLLDLFSLLWYLSLIGIWITLLEKEVLVLYRNCSLIYLVLIYIYILRGPEIEKINQWVRVYLMISNFPRTTGILILILLNVPGGGGND